MRAAHDISEGGLASAAAEMILANPPSRRLGLEVDITSLGELRVDALLFSESSGMLLEVKPEDVSKVASIYDSYGVKTFEWERLWTAGG